MTVCIPLYGGIGNIIQMLPFAYSMKKRYENVNAYVRGLYDVREEVMLLIDGVFDKIYPNAKNVPSNEKKFRYVIRRSFPESKGWFVDNKQPMPKRIGIPKINFRQRTEKHRVILWPECKPNWKCKRWPYWVGLSEKFDDVAVIGKESLPKFPSHVVDYRGKLDILESGGLIRNAKFYVGNEGGISHYSSVLGTKTFIIYGCTDPIKNAPYAGSVAISRKLRCQPCQFHGNGNVRGMLAKEKEKKLIMLGCKHRACLTGLSPEAVFDQIRKHL